MKSLFSIVLAVALIAGCGRVTLPVQDLQDNPPKSVRLRSVLEDIDGPVMVVAHRGCWINGAPENSLAAIADCIETGVDIIEIDVRLTADNVPVLLHDETLDRTTSGSGNILETQYKELQSLSLLAAAGGDAALPTSERVPTLRSALLLAKGNVLINLDVKLDIFDEAYEVVQEVGVEEQILMKMGVAADDPLLVGAPFVGKTMFMPIIRECTEIHLSQGTHCVQAIQDELGNYDVYNPIAYEITYSNVDFFVEGVQGLRDAGGRVWVNTLLPQHAAGHTDALAVSNANAHWGQVIRDGANIIQTDYPELLLDYLQQYGLR